MNYIRIPEDMSRGECRQAIVLWAGGLTLKDSVATASGVPMEWVTLLRDGMELPSAEIVYCDFEPSTTRTG